MDTLLRPDGRIRLQHRLMIANVNSENSSRSTNKGNLDPDARSYKGLMR